MAYDNVICILKTCQRTTYNIIKLCLIYMYIIQKPTSIFQTDDF